MIDNFENSKLLIIYLMMTDNNLLWVVFLSHSGGVRVSECGKEEIQLLNRTVGLKATVSLCTPCKVVSLPTTSVNFNTPFSHDDGAF